jgi:hypothetical protein
MAHDRDRRDHRSQEQQPGERDSHRADQSFVLKPPLLGQSSMSQPRQAQRDGTQAGVGARGREGRGQALHPRACGQRSVTALVGYQPRCQEREGQCERERYGRQRGGIATLA